MKNVIKKRFRYVLLQDLKYLTLFLLSVSIILKNYLPTKKKKKKMKLTQNSPIILQKLNVIQVSIKNVGLEVFITPLGSLTDSF